MAVARNEVDPTKLNQSAELPFELRLKDVEMAMQDVYDFFCDVNSHLEGKGLQRLDDMLGPAIMSGVLSDMLTASLAKHSRALTEVYLSHVTVDDFRRNERGELGTRTATLHRVGVQKFRANWVYLL